jgi:hypothetical protein
MKSEREFTGTLSGFDDFVNMVLDDAIEYIKTETGYVKNHLKQTLLNGNGIAMVSCGLVRDAKTQANTAGTRRNRANMKGKGCQVKKGSQHAIPQGNQSER